jgi:coenzyme F420-0:L-glutamate ligase/coenzyme F420-1:gamma-L-glutamate ligase
VSNIRVNRVYLTVRDSDTRGCQMARIFNVIGLEHFPMVKKGDNLAELILSTARKNNLALDDGDIVVVAHKIVSKTEGRIIRLSAVRPSPKAQTLGKATKRDPRLVELVLRDTKRVVKATSEILIVENALGFVCINAGVDKSNVQGDETFALLPINPDKSAQQIRSQIQRLTGKAVAVIICDTYSRPFRRGQVELAIGLSGMNPFRDYRGQKDLFGYTLKVKNSAIADEIASAAELLIGQGNEAIPVVVVKGLRGITTTEYASANDLYIPETEDLFKGTLP